MGQEWLEQIVEILKAAGIRAGEDYPTGEWMEITGPVAAVGLAELDCKAGSAAFLIRILSPRSLGGWACQTAAAKTAAALAEAGLRCRTSTMDYLSGNDCFCVMLTASMDVTLREGEWIRSPQWWYQWNDTPLVGVEEFTAERDLDRRIVGAFCQAEPVGVTPGNGGWKLTMIQTIAREEPEPEEPTEPFTLSVIRGIVTVAYSGCCWNSIIRQHTRQGLRIERRGFALSREVK